MATIVFALNSALSHHLASLALAAELKSSGHEVIYLGIEGDEDSKRCKAMIESNGFNFTTVPSPIEIVREEKSRGRLFNTPRVVIKPDVLAPHIDRIKPDVMLIDAFFASYAIILHRFNLKIILLQTAFSFTKSSLVPPPISTIIPQETVFCQIKIWLHWQYYFLKVSIENLGIKLLLQGHDFYSALTRLQTEDGFPSETIDRERFMMLGLSNTPEIILQPRELEFPFVKIKQNQNFVGPCVYLDRKENDTQAFREVYNQLDPVNKKVVYCSLGTIAADHSSHCLRFYKTIVECFRGLADYQVVMSIGNKIQISDLPPLPDHIFVFPFVPQLKVLKKTNLMIMAAGCNSVVEALLHEVPVLIYALNSSWDQNGTAARVKFHKVGIRGNMKRENVRSLRRKLHRIFDEDDFKVNVKRMHDQLVIANTGQRASIFVQNVLNEKELEAKVSTN